MCITTAAFAFFLSYLPADIVEPIGNRVIVHASEREAHWVANGDRWCTMAPQIDRMTRFVKG